MKKGLAVAFTTGLLFAVGTVGAAYADTIIDDSTYGYYNNGLGKVVSVTNDNTVVYPTAPDLSAATNLGNWLDNTTALTGTWTSSPVSIAQTWTVNTDTAIVYAFDAGVSGLTNVMAQFAVDNGIFVWLDGVYQYGWRAAGGPVQWEYSLDFGSLSAGTHYLQLLREDHGGSTGYHIQVTGDSAPVPEPATLLLFGSGIAGLAAVGRRKSR